MNLVFVFAFRANKNSKKGIKIHQAGIQSCDL